MPIECLDDLYLQARVVALKIIDVVLHRYPPDVFEFRHSDLFDHQASLRQECQSVAKDMQATIRHCVYALRDYNLLQHKPGERGVFTLLPNELLYLHVKLKRTENRLARYR